MQNLNFFGKNLTSPHHSADVHCWTKAFPNERHYTLSSAFLIQPLPATCAKSPVQRVGERPTLRLRIRGLHTRTFPSSIFSHRPSLLRHAWPVQGHSRLLIVWAMAMSVTFVLLQISTFQILSHRKTPNMAVTPFKFMNQAMCECFTN